MSTGTTSNDVRGIPLHRRQIGYCPVCRRNHPLKKTFCPSDGGVLLPVPTGLPKPDDILAERYLLRERAGEGGVATVYRALDLDERTMVAVKILAPSWMGERRFLNGFFREARIMREVEHPSIVRMRNFGATEKGYVYIVMDFLDGASLHDILTEEVSLGPEWAALIGIQLCHALGELHARRIVHNDLKPENVHLRLDKDFRLQVKLLDFGISHPYTYNDMVDGVRRDVLDGTPVYMSPEVIAGEAARPASDLYSLGVMLHEMVNGEPPFDDDDNREICRQHLFEEPPESTGPPALVDLIARLLDKEPPMRPQSVAELEEELLALTLELPHSPVPDSIGRLQERREAVTARLDEELATMDRPASVEEVTAFPTDAGSRPRRNTGTFLPDLVMQGRLKPSMCWVLLTHMVIGLPEREFIADKELVRFALGPPMERIRRLCTRQSVRLDQRDPLTIRLAKEASVDDLVLASQEMILIAKATMTELSRLRDSLMLPITWRLALFGSQVFFDGRAGLPFWEVIQGAQVDMVTRVAKEAPADHLVVGGSIKDATPHGIVLEPWAAIPSREEKEPVVFDKVRFGPS